MQLGMMGEAGSGSAGTALLTKMLKNLETKPPLSTKSRSGEYQSQFHYQAGADIDPIADYWKKTTRNDHRPSKNQRSRQSNLSSREKKSATASAQSLLSYASSHERLKMSRKLFSSNSPS